MADFVDTLKKPSTVIIGGVALAVLIFAMRGNGGNGDGSGLAALDITTKANIALSGISANAYTENLKTQAGLLALRDTNKLALQVQTMKSLENVYAITKYSDIQRRQIEAGITNNTISTNGRLEADRIAAALRTYLGPIEAQTAASIAQIQAASAQTVAAITSNATLGVSSGGVASSATGVAGLIPSVNDIIDLIGGFF